ncbi:chorismate mutase [Halalkalibacter akibai]|uniref:chorismate mutase n=1 Tax=Halalkalibacter akibai (strain ATCC 43226 / DSM 21942 / CIP 109018 / JCM 9157 / 1139) TaxID=1236973 RepID=W4QRK7_HALA3|nr:chorismate mutase [Halalkalibacter akibai]GAE34557.1 chorismate mutase II [Halalkalibacter akibai JCM 9157]
MVRGIRGAITIKDNTDEEITNASMELIQELIKSNQIEPDKVAQVLFTVTEDITAAFPAKVLREFPGWSYVPVVCAKEIPVPGSLPKCIRVLLTVNTEVQQDQIHHAYLRDARKLRPDLALTNE